MKKPLATLVIEQLNYTTPDSNTSLFQNASLHVSLGKVGLLGENGSGKSTLLALIAGQITAYEGEIHLPATLLYLEQTPTEASTAWDALGLGSEANTIGRCLRGNATLKDLATADPLWSRWSDWLEMAAQFNFDEDSLNRPLKELTPGQRQKLLFLKALIADPDVLLMDEPSNHLDREGRKQLVSFMERWKKGLILATHDRELLETIDAIVVIEKKQLRLFSGGYKEFEEARLIHQAKQEKDLQSAEEALRKAKVTQRQAMERQQKRSQRTAANSEKLGLPKILIGARKENAQNTSAKLGEKHLAKVEDAQQKRRDSQERTTETASIAMDLPNASAVKGRSLLQCKDLNLSFDGKAKLWRRNLNFTVKGGERWQILGANGSGKSSLLKIILGELSASEGKMIRYPKLNLIYLDQELSLVIYRHP
jgi:ATPase subunit of ABC transporter with duplicated ATPase domains